MDCSLSSILRLSGRHDGPQLALVESLFVASDPDSVMGAVIGDIQVLVLLDVLDPVHLALLLKDESLVGSTVEAVHDQLAIVGLVLSDIERLDAVSVNCVDDVVLVGLEVDGLGEAHALVVADVGLGDDVVDVQELLGPVEALTFVGVLLLLALERLDQPDLVAALMNVVLEHGFAFLSFASSNIQASSVGVSPDDVPLVSKLSLLGSMELEPAAGMLSSISDDGHSVVLLVLEDAQPVVVALGDDCKLVVLLEDVEVLVLVVVVLLDLQLVVLVDGQDHVGVEDREDFVEDLGVGLELRLDVGVNGSIVSIFSCFLVVLLGLFGLDGDEVPELVVALMNVVLENVLAVLSLSSSNVKSSVASVCLDKVGLLGPFALFSQRDFEPAAGMLILVHNDLSAIVMLVLEEAQSTVLALNHKGEFFTFPTNVELLVGLVLEGVNLEFSLLRNSQALVLIEDGYHLVGSVGLGLKDGRKVRVHLLNMLGLSLHGGVVLLGQVIGRNDKPALVDSTMELPLAYFSVGIGLTSFDVKGLSL